MYDISGEVSNAEDFDYTFSVEDTDGVAIDFSSYSIEFQLGDLEGTKTSGHITIPATGQFRVRFPADEISALSIGQQKVGCIYYDATDTIQLMVGSISVIDGNMQ